MKVSKKIEKNLLRRQKAHEGTDRPNEGLKTHKPGSLNRKRS